MIEEAMMLLLEYPVLVSFLVPFIFGGGAVIVLAVLAGRGALPLWIIMIFSMLAMFSADLFWFLFARIKALSHLKKIKPIHKSYKKAKEFMEEIKSEIILLISAKTAYGIGIPTIAYLGRRGMPLKKFLKYNSAIIAIWVLIISAVGFAIGKTSSIAVKRLESWYVIAGIIIACWFILSIISRKIRKKALKSLERFKDL